MVVGLISSNNKKADVDEVDSPLQWCLNNNFLLSINKTKELVVFILEGKNEAQRRQRAATGTSVYISVRNCHELCTLLLHLQLVTIMDRQMYTYCRSTHTLICVLLSTLVFFALR